MFNVSVSIDDKAFRQETLKERKRLSHDLVEALNDATKAVQAEWRRAIRKNTKVRRETFTMNQVKITQFASVRKGVVSSVLAIAPKPRSILAILDEGGERPNLTKAGKPMAIPVEGTLARPAADKPASLISRLKLQKDSKGEWKGQRRAFLIPGIGVFQRTGKGLNRSRDLIAGTQSNDELRLLWTLETRARISRAIHFQKIAEREFPSAFARTLTATIARRR